MSLVIRPNLSVLNSVYLKIFLDSPIGNKLINSTQQGTTIINISYKDFKMLEIPIPELENQKKVVIEYLEELKRYQEAVAAAENRWKSVLDRLHKF